MHFLVRAARVPRREVTHSLPPQGSPKTEIDENTGVIEHRTDQIMAVYTPREWLVFDRPEMAIDPLLESAVATATRLRAGDLGVL